MASWLRTRAPLIFLTRVCVCLPVLAHADSGAPSAAAPATVATPVSATLMSDGAPKVSPTEADAAPTAENNASSQRSPAAEPNKEASAKPISLPAAVLNRGTDVTPAAKPSVAQAPVAQSPSPPTSAVTPTPVAAARELPPEGEEKIGAVPATGSDVQRDFSRAQSLMDEGRESDALLSFGDFLRRYPNDKLSDDAQFAVAEIYFRQRHFDRSVQEFARVIAWGAGSDRVADASVRTGEAYLHLKIPERAQIEWEAVRRKFPKTEAARRAGLLLGGLATENRS